MATCLICGKALDEGLTFCNHCGTPVAEEKRGSAGASDPFEAGVKDAPAYGVVNLEQLPDGHVIDDRYEVKGKLGQGGFGAVYRVFDRKMECDKALKVLPEAVASDRSAMVSLKKEAVTMAKLNHPGIVHVYDFSDSGSIKYIDMELVEGTSLSDALLDTPEGCFDEERVKSVARHLGEALSYAHTRGVIHKDIKPQNILISKEGTPKITDFGISETVKSSMSRIANSSSSGTLIYMSPIVMGEAADPQLRKAYQHIVERFRTMSAAYASDNVAFIVDYPPEVLAGMVQKDYIHMTSPGELPSFLATAYHDLVSGAEE